MPEIDQVLTDVADSEIRVVFTPHLIPMDRGILSTCYAEPTGEFDDKSLLDVIKNFYANERFVRVTPNAARDKASLPAQTFATSRFAPSAAESSSSAQSTTS